MVEFDISKKKVTMTNYMKLRHVMNQQFSALEVNAQSILFLN